MQFLLQESKWNYRVQPWEIVELYVVYTITSAGNAISLPKLALWNTSTAENTNTITAGHRQIEGFWHAWVAAHSKCCDNKAASLTLQTYSRSTQAGSWTVTNQRPVTVVLLVHYICVWLIWNMIIWLNCLISEQSIVSSDFVKHHFLL